MFCQFSIIAVQRSADNLQGLQVRWRRVGGSDPELVSKQSIAHRRVQDFIPKSIDELKSRRIYIANPIITGGCYILLLQFYFYCYELILIQHNQVTIRRVGIQTTQYFYFWLRDVNKIKHRVFLGQIHGGTTLYLKSGFYVRV